MSFSISIANNEVKTLAIGSFDGLHEGHKQLIKRLDNFSAILLIPKKTKCLTTIEDIERLSAFKCFVYDFESIKNLNASEFLVLLEKDFPFLQKIVVGYDFRFGKERANGAKELKELFFGEVVVVDEYKVDNISVHSSSIVDLLNNGDIKMVNKLLGRAYNIKGLVVCGQGIGSKSLVPTINIKIANCVLPKEGVYLTYTYLNGTKFNSLTFVGHRVSTDQEFAIETHIVEKFAGEEANEVSIDFLLFLRENQKFDTLEKLKYQIDEDILEAKVKHKGLLNG